MFTKVLPVFFVVENISDKHQKGKLKVINSVMKSLPKLLIDTFKYEHQDTVIALACLIISSKVKYTKCNANGFTYVRNFKWDSLLFPNKGELAINDFLKDFNNDLSIKKFFNHIKESYYPIIFYLSTNNIKYGEYAALNRLKSNLFYSYKEGSGTTEKLFLDFLDEGSRNIEDIKELIGDNYSEIINVSKLDKDSIKNTIKHRVLLHVINEKTNSLIPSLDLVDIDLITGSFSMDISYKKKHKDFNEDFAHDLSKAEKDMSKYLVNYNRNVDYLDMGCGFVSQDEPGPKLDELESSFGADIDFFEDDDELGDSYYIDDDLNEDEEKVNYSLISEKSAKKGEPFLVDFAMYKDKYSAIIKDLVANYENPQVKSGMTSDIKDNTYVTIRLTSRDIADLIDEDTFLWNGKYHTSSLGGFIPEDYNKKFVDIEISVLVNSIKVSSLRAYLKVNEEIKEGSTIKFDRKDIDSIFFSYSSKDREIVIDIVKRIKESYKNIDFFLDVINLRSGEHWKERLYKEIDAKDTFCLVWSKNAYKSDWVEKEWRYALLKKGTEAFTPINLNPDNPDLAPIPEELKDIHFTPYPPYLER